MEIFFNTRTFDEFIRKSNLPITDNPEKAVFLVMGAKKVDFNKFNSIKAVYRFGVGTDNIDFKFLKQKAISVYFPTDKTKKILYDATANFTVYGILKILCKNIFGDVDRWEKKKRDYIGNKTALVIGCGNIGSRVAFKLKAFMKIFTHDICINKEEELEPLIKIADVITIHIPLDSNNLNYFNEEKLSWVKDNTLLVNTARGHLFDEEALYGKLKHTNCHAFFDVFWQEPYSGKLKSLGKDKFFMTPHSASNTIEFVSSGFKDITSIWNRLKKDE